MMVILIFGRREVRFMPKVKDDSGLMLMAEQHLIDLKKKLLRTWTLIEDEPSYDGLQSKMNT